MKGILRFAGALRKDPAVDNWLEQHPGELGLLARTWYARLRKCGPDVRELLHDGCPTVCVKDAPFAYTNVFKTHVNVGFFHGAALPDPVGMLQGEGKHMRHVKLRPGVATDASALNTLIAAAYADIRSRLQTE